jgi:hypothetical protein
MSDHSIISRDTIRARARRAFNAGRPRTAHNMNVGAAALVDWLDEYDRLTALESRRASRTAKALPSSHAAPAGVLRVDARQAGV